MLNFLVHPHGGAVRRPGFVRWLDVTSKIKSSETEDDDTTDETTTGETDTTTEDTTTEETTTEEGEV